MLHGDFKQFHVRFHHHSYDARKCVSPTSPEHLISCRIGKRSTINKEIAIQCNSLSVLNIEYLILQITCVLIAGNQVYDFRFKSFRKT